MNETHDAAPHDENALIAERRAKLRALREGQGIAFPNDYRRGDYAQDLQTDYADAATWTADALEGAARRVQVAGRMMAKRVMGKASFVQLQDMTGRSQHQNRDTAMKMLKAKLYELEVQKRNTERDALEAGKSDIGWGSQIRNYVLDQSRIKDLRTGIERTDTQKVLDGDLDEFVEASLKAGLAAGSKRSDAA